MFKKIQLPYEYNSLEPYYSEETLKLHYEKLYTVYIENANKTLEGLRIARVTGNYENIKCLQKNLSFFGSGAILHELFFLNIGPPRKTQISPELLGSIKQNFGSYEMFNE